MAEEYNVQAIMNSLKGKSEMDPDQHDGCYELMRETIEAYSKLKDFDVIDYKDLNLVYLTSVGTWKQGIESKKKKVQESHLLIEDKERLSQLWDQNWEKAAQRKYSNFELSASNGCSIGLFGTGFFSFKGKTTDEHAQQFIRMCVDILPLSDYDEIYDRAAKVLTISFKGMTAASASMVLHCLKPFTFPILNSNTGFKNIFEVMGVKPNKLGNIETYIENCRKIKAFRDQNFECKNYRIYDIAAQNVEQYNLSKHHGQFDSWEIVNDDVARKACDSFFFEYHGSAVPKGIRWFFDAIELELGQRQDIVLVYAGREYGAYIERESASLGRIRIYWDSSLAKKFEEYAVNAPQYLLEFRHSVNNRYDVELVKNEERVCSSPGIRIIGNGVDTVHIVRQLKTAILLRRAGHV